MIVGQNNIIVKGFEWSMVRKHWINAVRLPFINVCVFGLPFIMADYCLLLAPPLHKSKSGRLVDIGGSTNVETLYYDPGTQ